MSDQNSLQRQEQKKRMRQRILPDLTREQVEDLESTLRHEHWRDARKYLIAAVILIIAVLIARSVRINRKYDAIRVVWQEEDVGSSEAVYELFDRQVLKVTGEGISSMSAAGEILWNTGISMKSPRVAVQGKYGVVADLQAQSALIFNTEGITGTVTTSLPILGFTVSSHGVLALELDGGDVNYINFYDNTGKTLDIRIKTMLAGDGFPLDLSLSPSGTGLMTSVVYLDQGSMQNRLVFYNFDVGKSESDRIVGEFTYGGTMFPEVSYLSGQAAVAFGDNQVNFYSLRNESNPSLVRSISFSGDIYSVFYGENRVGVISSEEEGRVLTVFDGSGRQVFRTAVTFEYTSVEFSGKYVLLYNGSDCQILTNRGQIRFQGAMGGAIRKVIMTGDDNCLLFSGTALKKIRFR